MGSDWKKNYLIPMTLPIQIPQPQLADFCRRNHIRKLSFFGSVIGNGFSPTSDIDVLVEFEPNHIPGFQFFSMQDELTVLLGRQVDLNTPQFLSKYFRDKVMQEAVVAYAA